MKYITLALLAVLVPQVAFAVDLEVEIEDVPNSSAIDMLLEGRLEAEPERVAALLCHYPSFTKLTDTYEAASVVKKSEADRIVETPFEDVDDALEYIAENETEVSNCPGRSYVANVQDLPFPLSNVWSVSQYDAEVSGGHLHIRHKSVAASHEGSVGAFIVKPNDDGTTNVVMHVRYDLGFPLPDFLIKFSVSTLMPEMYEAMEAESKNIDDKAAARWKNLLYTPHEPVTAPTAHVKAIAATTDVTLASTATSSTTEVSSAMLMPAPSAATPSTTPN